MTTPQTRYDQLFSRNIGIFTEAEQAVLRHSCVAVAGTGGVGGIQLITLARAGVGNFRIADPEVFGLSDRNRQYGATESTLGKNKAEVLGQLLRDINPECRVEVFAGGVQAANMDSFLAGADVVIDAIEYFALPEKVALYRQARNHKQFVFTSPIIGMGSSLLVFDPEGIFFEDYFDIQNNPMLELSKLAPGLPAYADPRIYAQVMAKARPIPSFSCAATLSGALLANAVTLFLTKKKHPVCVPKVTFIDLCSQDYRVFEGARKVA